MRIVNDLEPATEQYNKKFYDGYYDKPFWWFRFRYGTQVKRKTVQYLLARSGSKTKNAKILEIGFGSGTTLFSLDHSNAIYGVEISTTAITRVMHDPAREKFLSSGFVKILGEKLPFKENAFDIVVASHVIEHITNDTTLVKEIYRVLRPGGCAILLIPINEKYDDPNHVHHYTSYQFRDLLRKCNFGDIVTSIENEQLFHLVEKFYFAKLNKKWRVLGPIIAAIFNFPTALMPFWMYRIFDRMFLKLGLLPRQFACVASKKSSVFDAE